MPKQLPEVAFGRVPFGDDLSVGTRLWVDPSLLTDLQGTPLALQRQAMATITGMNEPPYNTRLDFEGGYTVLLDWSIPGIYKQLWVDPEGRYGQPHAMTPEIVEGLRRIYPQAVDVLLAEGITHLFCSPSRHYSVLTFPFYLWTEKAEHSFFARRLNNPFACLIIAGSLTDMANATVHIGRERCTDAPQVGQVVWLDPSRYCKNAGNWSPAAAAGLFAGLREAKAVVQARGPFSIVLEFTEGPMPATLTLDRNEMMCFGVLYHDALWVDKPADPG